jgi:diamine N-acetyltransferase
VFFKYFAVPGLRHLHVLYFCLKITPVIQFKTHMTRFYIIRAGEADIDVLITIGKQTFFETFEGTASDENLQKYLDSTFTTSRLTDEIRCEGSFFYLLTANDEVIGYMKVNIGEAQNEFRYSDSFEIERLYIVKSWWGKTAGNTLFDYAIRLAKQMNIQMIWLGVWEHNARAIRFYEKYGFEVFGRHPFAVGEDVQTDLLMRMHLFQPEHDTRFL